MKVPFKGLFIGDHSEEVSNPLSGEKVILTPQAVAVYDVIKGAESTGNYRNVRIGCDWFIKHYPKEYMILLD